MFKKIVLALLILFVLLQLTPRSVFPIGNPPLNPANALEAHARALTPQVSAILERACYNCHSDRTVWPWYSKVAPVSWLLSSDVTEGRHDMNFSNWAAYTPKRTSHKLQGICEHLENNEMPPWYYRPLHPAAKLSEADKKAVCEWTRAEAQALGPVQ